MYHIFFIHSSADGNLGSAAVRGWNGPSRLTLYMIYIATSYKQLSIVLIQIFILPESKDS